MSIRSSNNRYILEIGRFGSSWRFGAYVRIGRRDWWVEFGAPV